MYMNQKSIIGIVALVVIVAGGIGVYVSNNSKKEAAKEQASAMEKEKDSPAIMQKEASTTESEAMMKKDSGDVMSKAGTYESYNASKLAMASATHNVVLFFRASWCPTCIAVDKDIRANLGSIPGNLTILDVNYDNSTELKKKYGITYQHTFVQVDAQGTLIKKWSGSPTLAAIVSQVK